MKYNDFLPSFLVSEQEEEDPIVVELKKLHGSIKELRGELDTIYSIMRAILVVAMIICLAISIRSLFKFTAKIFTRKINKVCENAWDNIQNPRIREKDE